MEQQSGEITSMAGAVEEFSATSLNIADNMGNTERLAQENAQQTRIGRTSMDEASSSLEQIAGALNSTATVINTLGQRSQEIGGIVGVITSIAEQTNLLALNAAIEAARAGEAGRGFAVVADEVRALAHRTQQSTSEIERMIGSIQSGTEHAVDSMRNSTERAESTLNIARGAGMSLDTINTAIVEINERNLVIASAAEEQAQVAREVDRNLVNIRDLSVQSATGANQTSAASNELSRLALDLNNMVGRFSL
jgi:methyl-accepting chemotaxis protein